MKKTSKAEFNRFKKEFQRQVEILGLKGYEVYFDHLPLNNEYANISMDEPGKVVTVCYSSELKQIDYDVRSPELSAKHEAIHLLLHRLRFLGEERFTASSE
ncbi:hypothetical protein LCGC14_1283310, partial [marine sediment metagenome]